MFTLDPSLTVYLHRLPIDFRKGINGLAALVEQAMQLNPFGASCFVFSNRRRDKIKLLFWHRNGFWLCIKRLEAERFVWPAADDNVVKLSVEQLHWLLDGYDLSAMRGHTRLHFQRAS